MAASHDSFYSGDWLFLNARARAERWQRQNDEIFVEQQALADADMRTFAYTFGNRVLADVRPCFYDSEEKYDRLRRITGKLDPDGLFSADQFSFKSL